MLEMSLEFFVRRNTMNSVEVMKKIFVKKQD